MKKQIILKIMMIMLISIGTIVMLNSISYAKDEKNQNAMEVTVEPTETDEKPTSTTVTSTNSSSTSNTQQTKKSNNANLSNLGIRPNDFTGFKMGTTSYEVMVPEKVKQVEVYATAQDAKASITGTGMKNLEKGKNTLSVVVTAEDGTTKTYTIHVTREGAEEENTENIQERYSGDGLATLKVGDLELSPKFDTGIYEYTVKYIGEEQKIEIEATATDPYYTIETTGNENLKEGENIITILISDPDGKNVATYQVMIHKSLVDEEVLAREQEEARKKEEQKKQLIVGGIVAVIVIGVILFLMIRHRKNRAWAEEYSVPFSGINDNKEGDYYGDDYEDLEDKFEEFEKDEIEMSKEQARKAYLSNYEADNYEKEYEKIERKDKPKRHKGKRFK